jgi:hypothetical protein
MGFFQALERITSITAHSRVFTSERGREGERERERERCSYAAIQFLMGHPYAKGLGAPRVPVTLFDKQILYVIVYIVSSSSHWISISVHMAYLFPANSFLQLQMQVSPPISYSSDCNLLPWIHLP